MDLSPRGLPVPSFSPNMRPPPGVIGQTRIRPYIPPPLRGSSRPMVPPFRPPSHSHGFPLPPTMPLRHPFPPQPNLGTREHFQGNAYSASPPMRGNFGGRRGGGRGSQPRGRGTQGEYSEISGGRNGNYYCETCDRSFRTQFALAEHLSQHQTCGLDGCQFTAHASVVTRHVEMQHATGLYNKISSVSNNPEDIAKWIAERKKRYPTRENVERQKKEHEEKMKRGERIEEDKSRFNPDFSMRRGRHNGKRGTFRGRGKRLSGRAKGDGFNKVGRIKPAVRKTQRQGPSTSSCLSEDEENQNFRGKLPAFLGTAAFSRENEETEAEEEEEKKFSDTEFDLNEERNSTPNVTAGSLSTVSQALSNIIGMYASGASDSDEEPSTSCKQPEKDTGVTKSPQTPALQSQSNPSSSKDEGNVTNPVSSVAHDSGSSEPEEVPIMKCAETIQGVGEQKENGLEVKDNSQSSGRKRKRAYRHRANKRKPQEHENVSSTSEIQKPSQEMPPKTWPVKRRRRSLLEKLLTSEIRHERNLILQCVRYIVNENFFDPENRQKAQGEVVAPVGVVMNKVIGCIRILRQCTRYVVQNNFFGVPCAEGRNCDEDEDD